MWTSDISLDTVQVGDWCFKWPESNKTVSRVAGGVGDNILFDGSSTLCQIKIKSVKNEESGEWICSLEKDGNKVNSSSVQLIEAMPATVDWRDVYGSMEVRSEGIHINNINCELSYFSFQSLQSLRLRSPALLHTADLSGGSSGFLER